MEEMKVITWLEEIKEGLDFQHLFEAILYGHGAIYHKKDFLEREADNWHELEEILRKSDVLDEETMNAFEKYGEILQRNYFEIGVRLGVCLEKGLMSNDLYKHVLIAK